MSTGKYFKQIVLSAFLLFQLIPAGIIVYQSYVVSQWDDLPGWIIDEENQCTYYTSQNAANRHITWDGICQDNKVHGIGTLTLYEENLPIIEYKGSLTSGIIEGYGKLVFLTDGDVYEGEFKNGKVSGFGHFYNDDGDHYEGNYINGLKSGWGTYWYEPDHTKFKYIGNWRDDMMNGMGTIYYRNGKEQKGIFQNGVLISEIAEEPSMQVEVPKNVLITNDDGVEDMNRLICLAEEISTFADRVVIAVSSQNRSGTSNRMIMPNQGYLNAKCLSVDLGKQIYIYEVDGYPADCVMLGALALFDEFGENIDLVISGINGGPNHGAGWFGSGTIGAARTAALAGIPAIAVSGIDEDKANPDGLRRICQWVAKLAQSDVITQIEPLEYITISIPENLEAIKGVKIVPRAITFDNAPFSLVKDEQEAHIEGTSYTWTLAPPSDPSKVYDVNKPLDVKYYSQDYIVIVPMSVDENDKASFTEYEKIESLIPAPNFRE